MNAFNICNVNVHAIQSDEAVGTVLSWFKKPREFHYISSTNINNIINAIESYYFLKVTNTADLSLPDGMSLIWYGRYLGYRLPKRCGVEELMCKIFELSNKGHAFKHYFYGSTQETLDCLKEELLRKYPNLDIVGTHSPPFRKMTEEDDRQITEMINKANPDFLWVSLGCPKQEAWLFEHRDKINAVVGAGAGAVFNFLSNSSLKAPKWMQYAGLEWFFRLIKDPKRLYKRYLIKYPRFFFILLKNRVMEIVKFKCKD